MTNITVYNIITSFGFALDKIDPCNILEFKFLLNSIMLADSYLKELNWWIFLYSFLNLKGIGKPGKKVMFR